MRGSIYCLAVFLILFSFALSGAAQPADQPPCEDCKAVGWGPNVHFSSVLTAGQTFKKVFSGSLTLGAAVDVWCQRVALVPVDESCVNGISKQNKADATAAIAGLKGLLDDPKNLSARTWAMKQLYFWSWNDLPVDGSAAPKLKEALLEQLKKLKNAGLMTLTFVGRAEADPKSGVDEAQIRKVRKLAKSAFQFMTIADLFSIPADPELFDDEDMELLTDAAQTGLLWDQGQVDALTRDGAGKIMPMAVNMCCDMKVGSPTYRQCIQPPGYTGGSCSMCGSYCCLGSRVCP